MVESEEQVPLWAGGGVVHAEGFSAWLWLHLEFPNLNPPALRPSGTRHQKIASCPEQLHQKFTFREALPRGQNHSPEYKQTRKPLLVQVAHH